jgi:hypothetical protein
VAIVFGILLVVGVVLAIVLSRSPSAARQGVTPSTPAPLNPAVPSAPRARGLEVPRGPDHFMWMDQYASPVGVDANGDGVEDLAGPFVLENNGKLEAYVGVLDGTDFHLVWKAGPFGIREKATRRTGVAVAKNRMVAVEVTGLAHLFDLSDGREVSVVPYTSEDSRGLCAAPDADGVVYLGNSWSTGTLIDVTKATTRPGRAPKGCDYDSVRRPRDGGDVGQRRMKGLGAAPPPGFDWMRDAAGDAVDGVGIATPKGDTGMVIVGLDPKTKAVRWQRSPAALFGRDVDKGDLLEVGDGAAYVGIASGLSSIDAAKGTLKWLVTPVGNSGVFNVTLTRSRFYVVNGEWPGLPVDVYDVASGKLVARLGHGRSD